MIKLLQDIDRKEAEELLSAFANSLLPDPGINPPSDVQSRARYERLVQEARRVVQVSAKDDSVRARSKLLKLVADEMLGVALSREEEKTAKERLGGRGELPIGQYEIKFGDSFTDLEETRGLTRGEVGNTILHPDAVEIVHVLKTSDGTEESSALAAKKVARNNRSFIILVQFAYKKTHISVGYAWLVPGSIDLFEAPRPSDVLRRFVEVFGVGFRLFGLPETLLILGKAIPTPDALLTPPVSAAQVMANIQFADEPKHYQFCNTFRMSGAGILEIVVAYVVDLDKYLASLREHGVRVPPNK